MFYPNFNEEKILWRKGFKYVAGLDEAGRGPLAGPVVAGAVIFLSLNNPPLSTTAVGTFDGQSKNSMTKKIINPKSKKSFGYWDLKFGISEVKDSKQLSSKKRGELYDIITNHPNIKWGIGIVSEKVIDKINILEATKLAMQKAITSLRCPAKRGRSNLKTQIASSRLAGLRRFAPRNDGDVNIDYLLIDGNFRLDVDLPQKSIIKGDQKVISISAASIIAKVTRDKIMDKYDKKYPQYGFKSHKGYPTKLHIKMLKKFGICPIHRKSFHPVRDLPPLK